MRQNRLKQKTSWLWDLTIFCGRDVSVTIGETIWLGRGSDHSTIRHETIHVEQQRKTGFVLFAFLYLFVLPFGWNPWRWRWEMEAYTKGSGLTDSMTERLLSTKAYGWLNPNWHR